jgi:glycosyltransferase involved in cell wall biosynthesis
MTRLLYVVTEDWYFRLHWQALAEAAARSGFEVAVATRINDAKAAEAITAAGLRLVPLAISRSSLNPLRELVAVDELTRMYRREAPDLVHHVAIKPVIYGSVAARRAGVPHWINGLPGLGYVYASDEPKARLLRPLIGGMFRLLLNHPRSRVLLQNHDDAKFFADGIVAPNRVHCVRGVGVDISRYAPTPEPEGTPLAVLAARMLWEKGVAELVEAARLLKARNVALRIALVGGPDPGNPRAVPEEVLRGWQAEGLVEWWGLRNDMPEVWRQASIAVLPTTYREGLPTVLLEAAASGRPLIATDMPGCREVVRTGETGLLVPPGDAVALADALATLAGDATLRARYGAAARQAAEQEFAVPVVTAQVLALYRDMLGARL